jgi:phosphoglycolate phosphatase
MKDIDAIIFDLDGTLWDGVPAYAEGWNEYFNKNNIERKITAQNIYDLMGLEETKYLEKVLPEVSVEDRASAYRIVENEQYKIILRNGGILFDGVADGIKALNKYYKLFIVSNCPKDTIKCFLKWSKLEKYFTAHIAHGENYKSKVDNIKLMIEKYHIEKGIYVGDTDSDGKSAVKADIPFIFMDYGFGYTTEYSLKFDHFTEFVNYAVKD